MVLNARACSFAVLVVAACDMAPLERDQLYGPQATPEVDATVADAAQPDAAAPLTPRSDAGPDAETVRVDAVPPCQPARNDGVLSGAVVDACTGVQVEALVGIAGRHTCSFPDKGSFFFNGLPVGCTLTLTSAAPGYRLFMRTLVIPETGASVRIELEREGGGCDVPRPAPAACRCDRPGCE